MIRSQWGTEKPRRWSDYSEGLKRHADDHTTARDWEDTLMIRLQRGTEKTRRWSHHSEGLRRHADDQTTARDWEDTQMIRTQRGTEKTRRWSEHSEGLRRHADDQNTARDWEDTQMIRLHQELSYCTHALPHRRPPSYGDEHCNQFSEPFAEAKWTQWFATPTITTPEFSFYTPVR